MCAHACPALCQAYVLAVFKTYYYLNKPNPDEVTGFEWWKVQCNLMMSCLCNYAYIYICIYYIYMCTHMCARTTYVMLCYVYIYMYAASCQSLPSLAWKVSERISSVVSVQSVQMWSMEEIWFPHVRFLHPKCGGWVGACAMQAQDCSVSRRRRGAIERGRAAVRAWSEPRRFHWVLPAVTGFVFGWLGCFIWLLLPTVVYAP